MLYFLISFVSFLILSKSLSIGFWVKPSSPIFWTKKGSVSLSLFKLPLPMSMPLKKKKKQKILVSKVEAEAEGGNVSVSLLDLPELALDSILERLSPGELCSVAKVCTSLRDRCQSDYLWEKHLKMKWGQVIGDSAFRQWRSHVASCRNTQKCFDQGKQRGLFHAFRPFLWITSKSLNGNNGNHTSTSSPPHDSIMAFYLSLTTGIHLMGRWASEENIQWDRLFG